MQHSFIESLTTETSSPSDLHTILTECGLDYTIAKTSQPIFARIGEQTFPMGEFFAIGRVLPSGNPDVENGFLPFVPAQGRHTPLSPCEIAKAVIEPLILSGLPVRRAAAFAQGRSFMFVMGLQTVKTAHNEYRAELIVTDSCDGMSKLAFSIALTNLRTKACFILPLAYRLKHTQGIRIKLDEASSI